MKLLKNKTKQNNNNKKNAGYDVINTSNNIVLNFMIKISDEPFEKYKRRDNLKDCG